jgi:hypothetical protein
LTPVPLSRMIVSISEDFRQRQGRFPSLFEISFVAFPPSWRKLALFQNL